MPPSILSPLSWPRYALLSILILLIPPFTLLALLTHDALLRRRMPPGPPPVPILGNKPHLAGTTKPWLQFQSWSRIYGPIYTIWLGRRPTLIISDPCVAAELMEGRSAKYSSRPRMVAMGELYWDNASILVQRYGKAWSLRRRLLHLAMTPKALRGYKPVQEAEASRLCFGLLNLNSDKDYNNDNNDDNANGQKYVTLIETFTASVVFCVAYGHRIDSLNARVIHQRFEFMQYSASLNVPGRYLVESLPWLKHIPDFLAPWKADIKAHGRREAEANAALMDLVRDDMERASRASAELAQAATAAAATTEDGSTGTNANLSPTRRQDLERQSQIPDSLCKILLEMRQTEEIPLTNRDLSYIPASLFGAGSDTTASTLCSALLALITHPETLHAAQQELDHIVGPSRTPTFEDEAQLPYLRALCKEVLRWRPVAVLGGTPHATTEDDWYNGFYIPRGTTILGNSWAINMNEVYYPNPHHFNPLRFLDENVAARVKRTTLAVVVDAKQPGYDDEEIGGKAHPSKSGHSSFGWGRRICPGANLASNSLYIALAKMLWAFDIKPLQGVQYDIFDYTEGFNIRPRPFKCAITVRSENHRAVLEREQQEAVAYLQKFSPFSE